MDIQPAWVVALCAGIGATGTLVAHIRNDAVKAAKHRERFRRFRKEVREFMNEVRRK